METTSTHPIERIISGGQTGADRGALDFAIAMEIPHGGWCPKGRKSLDGKIPDKYNLYETDSGGYLKRTEFNVRDSDGTVIFTLDNELEGGSLKTAQYALKHGKPFLHLHMHMTVTQAATMIAGWILAFPVANLNVAGSRATKAAGIEKFVAQVLHKVTT